MAYELREGQGSLFANKNRASDNQPNARGDLLLNGVMYEVSAWTKEGKNGRFQSLQVKPKEQRQQRSSQPRRDRDDPRTSAGRDRDYEGEMYGHGEDDGEIPF